MKKSKKVFISCVPTVDVFGTKATLNTFFQGKKYRFSEGKPDSISNRTELFGIGLTKKDIKVATGVCYGYYFGRYLLEQKQN